jgi:hypothetical protein
MPSTKICRSERSKEETSEKSWSADHISHRCRAVPVACRTFSHSVASYCRTFYPALDKCRDSFQRQLDRRLVGTRECPGYDTIGNLNGIKPAVVTAGLVLDDCRVVIMGGGTRQHARQSAAVRSAVRDVRSAVTTVPLVCQVPVDRTHSL